MRESFQSKISLSLLVDFIANLKVEIANVYYLFPKDTAGLLVPQFSNILSRFLPPYNPRTAAVIAQEDLIHVVYLLLLLLQFKFTVCDFILIPCQSREIRSKTCQLIWSVWLICKYFILEVAIYIKACLVQKRVRFILLYMCVYILFYNIRFISIPAGTGTESAVYFQCSY